jgi:hypothetical protein
MLTYFAANTTPLQHKSNGEQGSTGLEGGVGLHVHFDAGDNEGNAERALGGLSLRFCLGAPEFQVTPLIVS